MGNYDEYLDVDWLESFVKLDTGINMAYCECGDKSGVPLVLIHGVTDGRVSWAQVAPLLGEKGYHCYIVEYRGNGKTDKPDQPPHGYTAELLSEDIIDFMDKTGIERAHVAGHSFGSLIVQVLAARNPERFYSCILIDAAVDCRSNPVLKSVMTGNDDGFEGIGAYDDFMPDDFVEEWTATTNEDEAFKKATYEHAKQLPAVAWRNLMNGLINFNSSEFIRRIRGNILVMWGTADEIFTKEDQEQLRAGLVSCNAEYIDIEGASHNGFWDSIEMAEIYAAHMDSFMRKFASKTIA